MIKKYLMIKNKLYHTYQISFLLNLKLTYKTISIIISNKYKISSCSLYKK